MRAEHGRPLGGPQCTSLGVRKARLHPRDGEHPRGTPVEEEERVLGTSDESRCAQRGGGEGEGLARRGHEEHAHQRIREATSHQQAEPSEGAAHAVSSTGRQDDEDLLRAEDAEEGHAGLL